MTTLPPEIERMISGRIARETNSHGSPLDNAPPAMGPEDYGVTSSSKIGIVETKGQSTAKGSRRLDWREKAVNADRLQGMTFNPVTFVVPGLIPSEGATLICSKPKVGKSWLVLDIAIGATTDRFVLGELKPKQGDVLYLALEDSSRRLQSRMTKLLGAFVETWPPGLTFATQWARVDQGGLDDLRAWCHDKRSAGRAVSFIAIDVLKIVRAPPKSGQTPYEADYEAIRVLQQLALELGVPIVIVHHTRKAQAEDLMDMVSGTYGIVGAADTIIVVDRQAQGVVVDVRGRDVEANTFAAEFYKGSCRWTLLGDAADVHQSAERQLILAIFAKASGPLDTEGVIELGQRLGHWDSSLGQPKAEAVRKMLSRMCSNGILMRVGRGKYAPKNTPYPSGPNVPNEDDEGEEWDNGTVGTGGEEGV